MPNCTKVAKSLFHIYSTLPQRKQRLVIGVTVVTRLCCGTIIKTEKYKGRKNIEKI